MAAIVLYTSGTMGDHLPYIALGQTLKSRGHQVRLVINQAMHAFAQRAGLEAVAITDIERGPEEARENAWAWDHWNYPRDRLHPKASILDADLYVTQVRGLIAACRDADVLIATSIRTHGYLAATALGMPWLTASMNPFSFWIPAAAEERQALLQARRNEYERLKELVAYTYSQLGVNNETPPFSLGWLWARHVLLASSPHFSLPNLKQLQPRNSIDLTGFWFYQDPDWEGWQPEERLRRFCEPDDPTQRPIALTFSSQPLENPKEILNKHAQAAAQLGRPLLVQRGWAGFSEDDLGPEIDPAMVMFADYLPHDWLFARAACAIQHGGIGTIARALLQGCPLLIEPFGNDQVYNATRVTDLGVGFATHPFYTTIDDLVQILGQKILSQEYRQRTQELGAKIRAENGLETACEYIERFLDRLKSNRELPAIYERFTPPLTPRRRAIEHIDNQEPQTETTDAVQESQNLLHISSTIRIEIPKIIHQTWKDLRVPQEFTAFQRTWQVQHPSWEYRLWTDVDNREFLRQNYAWFLPIYDNYPEHIMRVDAARYFILHHYGGVYVDLDFECLRPLEPLLVGKQVVFGLEPDAHLELHFPKKRGLERILCNAFMASAPNHPFWEHVFKQLVAHHQALGPLDAAGPFLLTRAYESYERPEEIDLVPSELLYPVSSLKPWDDLPADEQAAIRANAYAIHHWGGTWWRQAKPRQQDQAKVTLLVGGESVSVAALQLGHCQAALAKMDKSPRLSCLMITGGSRPDKRLAMAQRAVRCFLNQTYPNKELVIIDDGEEDALEYWIEAQCPEALDEEQIALVRLPPENKTLGELRNIAIEWATGEYIAQWDDDDLSDPLRLEIQMAVIHATQADACMLERHQIWWPESQRLAVSTRRIWESSFVCALSAMSPYPAQRSGEDTPVIQNIVNQGRVAVLDLPWLYTYVFHGGNTFQVEHWEEHWKSATESYEGPMYDIKMAEIEARLNLGLLQAADNAQDEVEAELEAMEKASKDAAPHPDRPEKEHSWEIEVGSTLPMPGIAKTAKILALVPVKDAAPYLQGLWANLRCLSYPHDRISLAFLESDSLDGTYELIEKNLAQLRAEFSRVELFKRDYAYRSSLPRWEPSQQRQRRSILAKSRNYLLIQALQDEDWVLWIDVDVASWPEDIIEQMLAAGVEIVAPHCLALESRTTFDLNTFKLKPGAADIDWSPYIVDGILQPPKGLGRLYLSDLRSRDLVEVDGLGATMLLVKADLHREGLIFPPFPYKLLIESEGLANMARDMGYRCWGMPNLEIFHP
jgi:mannosyltransferase OCH1-like enzyme/UDP:flavonoid glycosyltransferase YjiC (YdhE family)/glycosyltransferase involved in cell wall biosynthesis